MTNFRNICAIPQNISSENKRSIYRCGALCGLSHNEIDYIKSLNIKGFFDLRSIPEQEAAPCNECFNIINACAYSQSSTAIEPAVLINKICNAPIEELEQLFSKIEKLYIKLPFENSGYKKVFTFMQSGESLVYFCTAGKDRTGVLSALIMWALGADFVSIKNDFLISNQMRKLQNQQIYNRFSTISCERKTYLHKLLNVDEEWLNSMWETVLVKYKTPEQFFLAEYGITSQSIENWKQNYGDFSLKKEINK